MLRQAGGIYEMSQTCSQTSSDSAVGRSYRDRLRADDDQRCRRNFPVSHLLKMVRRVAKVDPSVRFNYQSIGSGGGQKQILAQTVDFGASDGPMTDDNLTKAPGKILHIPTVAGAVVVAYDLPGNPR